MNLVKEGTGKAKHFADLARVEISLATKGQEREGLLDKYLMEFETMKETLTPFMEKYGVALLFKNYFAGRQDKQVEIKDKDRIETVNEFDYFYIKGSFNMEIPIINNDRHAISELMSCISEMSLDIHYNVEFTLSERMLSKVRAEATNNALDNIEIEVRQIANHLGKKEIELINIAFNGGHSYGASRMRKSISSPAERVRVLDEMLESKEIEVTSMFTSEWEIR